MMPSVRSYLQTESVKIKTFETGAPKRSTEETHDIYNEVRSSYSQE